MSARRRSNQTVPKYISIKVSDELYELVAEEAERAGSGLIDVVVRALANHLKRPSLAYVPRQKRGPKPATNGTSH